MKHYDNYESPLGVLRLYGCDGVLTGLSFEARTGEKALPGEFDLVKKWLDDYFRGRVREPDFPMKPEGTAFQQLIWNLLQQIPFGETKTYGQLAAEAAGILGKDKMSAQAVGQAANRNPIAIIIPCHRCVGAGGNLTGYASGLHRKAWLLNHEQNNRG